MNKKIELLAPGGDIDSIKAAILAGADAIYLGLDKFNARNRAVNINFEQLQGILRLAHNNNCQIFLTLNIIIIDNEIPAIVSLLNKLINTTIDGVIVQDLGLLYILSVYFPKLKIHISTQSTTHNEGQINFLSKFNIERVNLSRELNINEIKSLTSVAHENNILTEVFVHGSYCISFSGLCYMSSVHTGNSGNRGRCSQPCRDRYITTESGVDYPLNLKDNSAFFDLKELVEVGVDSLKIEGRIKKFDYVYTVVSAWRNQLNSFFYQNKLIDDNSVFYKVFNRDFSNAYLKGNINKEMFIDNPRDHSITHLKETNQYNSDLEWEKGQLEFYHEKDILKQEIEDKIKRLSIEKEPLIINVVGVVGKALKVIVTSPEKTFEVYSDILLKNNGKEVLDRAALLKRFKAFNDTEYVIKELNVNLQGELYIPFKELTSIKKRILFTLNDSKEIIDPVNVPILKTHKPENSKPKLSVLISSLSDVYLCEETNIDVYFELPNSIEKEQDKLIDLFTKNKKLIPWFSSVLIGEDYSVALEFLKNIEPKLIVTNNTGIAYEANKYGIDWIAGPYLNIVNSFSLIALKDNSNCIGSFISNEISKEQIKQIKKPENFQLYYSIYHPIMLMESRQCLFQQVTGCKKHTIDDSCIQDCEKRSSITNLKGDTFIVEKRKGNYNVLYNDENFLNTDIIEDIPNAFSSFFIDLSEVNAKTRVNLNKMKIIKLFENIIGGSIDSKAELNQVTYPTTKVQYIKGI